MKQMNKYLIKYRNIRIRDKLLYLILILAVVATLSWQTKLDVLTVTTVSAGIFIALHVLFSYPRLLLTSIVYIIHISLIPYVSLGYATVSQKQGFIFDYQSNFLIIIISTIIISILAFRIRPHSPWLVLTVSFVMLNVGGLLFITFFLGAGYGAPIGTVLALVSLLLWRIPFRKKKSSIAEISLWKNFNATGDLLSVEESYSPLTHINIIDNHVVLMRAINPGIGLKIKNNQLFYRHQKLESLYASMLDSAQKISVDAKIDIRKLHVVLLSDKIPTENNLIYQISNSTKNQGFIHISTLSHLGEIILPDTILTEKELSRIKKLSNTF